MNRSKLTPLVNVIILGCVTTLAPAVAAPLGTAFTFQGRLTDGFVPANAQYDFVFRLYDAATLGSQIGSDVTVGNLMVTDGLFTTSLDFGVSALDGNARWLEIAVRPGASSGAYSTLSPRQALTATPYALYALNGGLWEQDGTAITNTNTGFVGVNRATKVTNAEYFGVQAPVSSGYGGMYIATDGDALPFYGYDTPSHNAWTQLSGADGKWQLYTDGVARVSVTSDGDVGIGDSTPDARLQVATSSGNAIHASATDAFSYGVYATGVSAGVRGESGASGGAGVYGQNNTNGGAGVEGHTSATGASGVAGYGNFGTGVYGQTANGWAIYGSNGGSNTTGYAGYFNGRVHVQGTLSKNSGSFKIDHPLDPANKYLSHSFVESPDMMNVYNGVVVLEADGTATIALPEWFQVLNRDFRYQLTAIGAPAPNLYIAQEVENNQFVIAGGAPNQKVSWQVTGIRQDPWAEAHRIQVEEEKVGAERGLYLNPELYGADASLSVDRATHDLAKRAPQDAPATAR